MVLIEAEIDELLTAENLKTKKPRTWRGFPVLSCFLTNNLDLLAERTGLEPATPCVTGRYSNQLNYHSIKLNVLGIFINTLF
jgi:hypothetical protein